MRRGVAVGGRFWLLLGWYGALALSYVWWVLPRLGVPLLTDEAAFASVVACAPAELIPIIPHPFGYIALLKAVTGLGWAAGPFLRVVGVGCCLLTMAATASLAERLTRGAGALAALVWLTHPLAIQGSLLLDIDNTLLTTVMASYLALLLALPVQVTRRQLVWLGVALGACLWVKLSCAPFLLAAVGLRMWAMRQWRRGAFHVMAVAAVGGAVFLGTWLVVARALHVPWASIFEWVATSAHPGFGKTTFAWSVDLANRAIRLALWLNPWLVCLLGLIAFWVRRLPAAERWRWICLGGFVAAMLLGYWLVRGMTFGFAKYHVPALPVAVALISACAVRVLQSCSRREAVFIAVGLVMSLAYYGGFVGDLLYQVNYTLRIALITGTPSVGEVIRHSMWEAARYLVPGVLVGVVAWRLRQRWWRVTVISMCVLLVGSNVVVNLRQRRAPHATAYNYGLPWAAFREAVQWLAAYRQAHPGVKIIAPLDVVSATGVPYEDQVRGDRRPHVLDAIRGAVDDPLVGCVMYGLTANDVRTWRLVIQDPQFATRLRERFTPTSLGQGEYVGWVRK